MGTYLSCAFHGKLPEGYRECPKCNKKAIKIDNDFDVAMKELNKDFPVKP